MIRAGLTATVAFGVGALFLGTAGDEPGVLLPTASQPVEAQPLYPSGELLRERELSQAAAEPELCVASVMRGQAEPAACAADASLSPSVRVVALKRLARTDPPAALAAALDLLESDDSLLRANAIAVLARNDSPRARDALSQLDPRSKRLANVLANRR